MSIIKIKSIYSLEEIQKGQVFLFDKPKGWTSFDLVKKFKNILKKTYDIKKIKVGHAGTLDPLATGLLIICVGKATKKISDIQKQKKIYSGEITIGSSTPSYDLETNVNFSFPFSHIKKEDIKKVAKRFLGEIDQVPPIFSAIKQNGERLYKKARRGEMVEIKTRKVFIDSFVLKEINLPKISFEIKCSKGTYIRSR